MAKALKKEYRHKEPTPAAIVQLLKPIFAQLGSRTLLEKCVPGYTQNANESLHSLVCKFCPKQSFLGKEGVETACALAVSCFNDGVISLTSVGHHLGLESTPLCEHFLLDKDIKRIEKSKYKASEEGKRLRRAARRKRKGLDDKCAQSEDIMYAPGALDAGEPRPSKRCKHKAVPV